MSRVRDRERGQSLVEFALVLPVLVFILMGIIDFGRIFNADLVVSEAARDAVRYASVGESDAAVEQIALTDAQSVSGVTALVTPPSTVARVSGSSVTVVVSGQVALFDPLLAGLLGSPFQVQGQVTMRVE